MRSTPLLLAPVLLVSLAACPLRPGDKETTDSGAERGSTSTETGEEPKPQVKTEAPSK